jgi:hypothetical protein
VESRFARVYHDVGCRRNQASLDAARNDTIWKKASDKIKQSGVQVTVTVLEELLKKLLKDSLGLP